jgi:hypothetical protein
MIVDLRDAPRELAQAREVIDEAEIRLHAVASDQRKRGAYDEEQTLLALAKKLRNVASALDLVTLSTDEPTLS